MIRLRESLLVVALFVQGALGTTPAGAQAPVTQVIDSSVTSLATLRDTDATDSVSVREGDTLQKSVVFSVARPAGLSASDAMKLPLLLDTPAFDLTSQDTIPRRRAVAYSDWYSRRLTMHRYGSYVMLPLFVTQYVLGNKLMNQKEDLYAGVRTTPVDKGLRSTHAAVAGGVGALFLLNTTTGIWNLIESRNTEQGRVRRTVHALTMLTADAGFAYVGYLGSQATDRGPPQARKHRNTALGSMVVSTAGAAIMWFGQR